MTTTTTLNTAAHADVAAPTAADVVEHRAPSGRGRRARAARSEESEASRAGGFFKGLLSGILTVALVGIVALAIALAVVPRVLGGAALTVLSGSMQPTFTPGDVVVSVPQERYVTGDVITFQPYPGDPTLITHRVVSVMVSADGVGYVTRGDANGANDEPITADQVMGRVVYSVPWIGNVTALAGSRAPLLVTAGALALIGYGAYSFLGGVLDERKKKGPKPAHGTDETLDEAAATSPTSQKDAS